MHRSIRALTALVVTVGLVAGSALAAAATATGPDVSSWNHPGGAAINWRAVRAAGHTFAFVKATQGPSVPGGTFYTNPWYGADSQDAMAAGLYVGSYDFAEPALPLSTAALQARAFVSVVGSQHGRQQLPPVLDLEQTGGLSATNLRSWVQSWLTETQHLTGRTPMIYTGPNFWKTAMGNTSAMSGYHLWLASWTSAKTPGVLPGGWSTWTMWQYTDAAKVAGITGSVDLSRYCCTMSNLAGLADGSNDRGASNPFGNLDGTARAPGTLTVSGWAIDPDTNAPLTVHVYVDGKYATKGVHGREPSRRRRQLSRLGQRPGLLDHRPGDRRHPHGVRVRHQPADRHVQLEARVPHGVGRPGRRTAVAHPGPRRGPRAGVGRGPGLGLTRPPPTSTSTARCGPR